MTTLPPFSLLLPVYGNDDPAFLERAFRSAVDEQTVRPAEVVLVQDGPVGGKLTAAIAGLMKQSPVPVNLVAIPKNVGLAAALSRGLVECAHEIIARMDADDISTPDRFATQLPMIVEGLDLVGSGMFEFAEDESGREVILGRRVPPIVASEIRAYARFHDPFNHPTVVYTKSSVLAAGGYQSLGMMEDYWLFARMIASGARVGNSPDPLVKYRVSAGAYDRRGGWALLRSELMLQRAFRGSGFTSRRQYLRNVLVRGGYRLVPVGIRRFAYRRVIAKGFHDGSPEKPTG